jgi:hypothetical protein
MDKKTAKSRLLLTASWHEKIARQLADPILPKGAEETRRREIETQQERHALFAKTIKKLAAQT